MASMMENNVFPSLDVKYICLNVYNTYTFSEQDYMTIRSHQGGQVPFESPFTKGENQLLSPESAEIFW